MLDWRDDIEQAIDAFIMVAELARDPISIVDINVEYLSAPHRPRSLPRGSMAVYAFWGDGSWLKIGKVGAKSNARYVSQHYNAGSARSTLAGSLVNDPHMLAVHGFDPLSAGDWIRQSTHRVNMLLPVSRRPELLSLLEAFLHTRLHPRYEQ
jgi:hypothetical protein